ncbi:ATP-dependent nuclease subunit B [Streptococcus didelphis]|uniref:ATP-dependent nuclease subunit B n=1 Tax=Streptococcus didelphis TaxID=102886 RepID=UPI00036F2144|nr:ATP-dependent nuclease subunit B [Streptococcus didelphis]
MRLLYTDINYSLTEILVKEADSYAKKGYRVFYIAPNSLSFEKERAVLELLPEQASFDITITRFAQMARYFTLKQANSGQILDENGLLMVLYQAILHLKEGDLRLYHRLQKDLPFIKQLVELYQELKTANLDVSELILENIEKKADLLTIFSEVDTILKEKDFAQVNPLTYFAREIKEGSVDQELEKTVIIVDGFTRFSAEEEYLISLLNEKCHQVVIASYASSKAYHKTFIEGNAYQASLEFLKNLSLTYQIKAEYHKSSKTYLEAFTNISRLFEAHYDFSQTDYLLSDADKEALVMWQSLNQKEEIEHVARDIRQKLYEGYRYKDILVLLGDVDAYQMQIGPIFDKYEIPYYFGKSETMSHHPLVQFIESLERCRRYNWRKEDIINLLKSSLFGDFTTEEIDHFDYYLAFADINGYTKFSRDFTVNSKDSKNRIKYDLQELNQIRIKIVTPLQALFKSQKQLGQSLIQKIVDFFTTINLAKNFQALSLGQSENVLEKDQEVWKTFTTILENYHLIFGKEKISLEESLSLLKLAMQSADYRTIPATLDVVSVKSYDLVEAHSKPFVYAIGLSQSNFPKQVKNTSLISDQERAMTNQQTDYFRRFDISSDENSKKNHYTALSLLNSAQTKLVLSFPLVLNEVSCDMSVYLSILHGFGIKLIEKDSHQFSDIDRDIGNYKSLLSQVIELNRSDLVQELNQEEASFWTVMLRYLKKRFKEEKLIFPEPKKRLQTKVISQEVIEAKYPKDKPISLSNSALTIYYNNQYKFFLQYLLGLQEIESIHPDARHHGTYLHKVFELLMADNSSLAFDAKLNKAIMTANEDKAFKTYYQNDAQGRYSLYLLEDIARSTAAILKENPALASLSQEKTFQLPIDNKLLINGTIDRIDRLKDQSIGIVDYKSSSSKFDIGKFYNGLNSQLVTYMAALKESQDQENSFFGAMYLHMQEPKLDLAKFKLLDSSIIENLYSQLTYKGIFLKDESHYLDSGIYQTKNNLYSHEEIDLLLKYNRKLYLDVEKGIREGHFLINPYTEDGKSVQGDQLKAITGFEADLDLNQARPLLKLPAKEKREGFFNLMKTANEGE